MGLVKLLKVNSTCVLENNSSISVSPISSVHAISQFTEVERRDYSAILHTYTHKIEILNTFCFQPKI